MSPVDAQPVEGPARRGAQRGPAREPEGPVGPVRVADVRHAVGNLLHKVYYAIDVLRGTGTPDDGPIGETLDRNLHELERLMMLVFEVIEPKPVACVVMPVRDLVRGVRAAVAAGDVGSAVDGEVETIGFGQSRVMVDPSRLSHVLRSVWSTQDDDAGAPSVEVSATHLESRRAVSIRIGGVRRPCDATAGDVVADLLRTIATETLERHHGRWTEETEGRVCLTLPLHDEQA